MLDNARGLLGKIRALQAGTPDSPAGAVRKPSEVKRLVPDNELAELGGAVPLSIVTRDIDGQKAVVVLLERQIKHDGEDNGASYTISGQPMYASVKDLAAAGGFEPIIAKVSDFYDKKYGAKPPVLAQGVGKPDRGGLKAQAPVQAAVAASDAASKAVVRTTHTDFSARI